MASSEGGEEQGWQGLLVPQDPEVAGGQAGEKAGGAPAGKGKGTFLSCHTPEHLPKGSPAAEILRDCDPVGEGRGQWESAQLLSSWQNTSPPAAENSGIEPSVCLAVNMIPQHLTFS